MLAHRTHQYRPEESLVHATALQCHGFSSLFSYFDPDACSASVMRSGSPFVHPERLHPDNLSPFIHTIYTGRNRARRSKHPWRKLLNSCMLLWDFAGRNAVCASRILLRNSGCTLIDPTTDPTTTWPHSNDIFAQSRTTPNRNCLRAPASIDLNRFRRRHRAGRERRLETDR